ncbi:MAG: hypothetical protein ACP5MZ_00145 [Candidatus Micrarchaeia archaeon]
MRKPYMYAKHVALVLALLLLLSNVTAASSASNLTNSEFCTNAILQSNAVLHSSSYGGMLGISMLILALVALVIGIAYMVGYSFKVEKLVQFSKAEMGEIFVTLLIILIFFGAIYSVSPTGFIKIGPSSTYNTYYNDCTLLAGSSVDVFRSLATYFIPETYFLQILRDFNVKIMPLHFGISFTPLKAFGLLYHILNLFTGIAGGLAGLFIALIVFLSIIYSVFPVFLFLGIILRSIPWTRAAGGAFLGLFIAFYLMFPILLYFMLQASPASSVLPIENTNSYLNSLSNFTSASGTFLTSLADAVSFNIIALFITDIVEPMIFTIFVLIISLIVSYDFMELMGDALGAPSLSSSNTLKRVL